MCALVVEDDPAVAPDVAQALSAAGFTVDIAADGEEAWYRGDVEDAEHLYAAADSGDANAIEALVVRLRRKLGAEVITTRRGFGYQIEGAKPG